MAIVQLHTYGGVPIPNRNCPWVQHCSSWILQQGAINNRHAVGGYYPDLTGCNQTVRYTSDQHVPVLWDRGSSSTAWLHSGGAQSLTPAQTFSEATVGWVKSNSVGSQVWPAAFRTAVTFSVDLWFKQTAAPASSWCWVVCLARSSHASPFYIWDMRITEEAAPKRIETYLWRSDTLGAYAGGQTTSGIVYEDRWHHWLATFDSKNGDVRTWIDGKLIQSWTGTTGSYSHNNNSAVCLGINPNLTSNRNYSFSGAMCNVRFFNKAFDAATSHQLCVDAMSGYNQSLQRGPRRFMQEAAAAGNPWYAYAQM